MKNENIKPFDSMKKWIVEASTDSPGDEFHLSVLKKIEALPRAQLVYEPVISPLGWKIILGGILSVFVWCILFVPSQPETTSLFNKIPWASFLMSTLKLADFNFQLAETSPHFLFGIVVFSIMTFILLVGTDRNNQAEI